MTRYFPKVDLRSVHLNSFVFGSDQETASTGEW